MEYWESLRWGAYMAVAVATWRFLPLAVVQMVAAFTRDEARSRQCMEVLRLSRRDVRRVPSYLPPLPIDHETCGRAHLPDLTQRPQSRRFLRIPIQSRARRARRTDPAECVTQPPERGPGRGVRNGGVDLHQRDSAVGQDLRRGAWVQVERGQQ